MKSSCKSESASGLLAVLFFMVLTTITIAMVYSVTSAHVAVSKRTIDRSIAVTYADGVLESLFDQWRTALTGVTVQADRTQGLSTTDLRKLLSPPDSSTLPPPPNVSLVSWSVTALDPLLKTTNDANGRPVVENGTNSTLRVRAYYNASVTVQFRSATSSKTTTVQRIFVRGGRNIFDNFFFGTQPNIEFHPGPEMYVTGTAYIGGNLFTAHNSLHFQQDVTFTGSQTLNYRKEDPRYGSTKAGDPPDITNGGLGDNWSLNNPPHVGSQQKLFDVPDSKLDPKFIDDPSANDKDSDTNLDNDGYHEIIEEAKDKTNDPLQLDAADSERLADNADYRIYVNTGSTLASGVVDSTVSIYKGSSKTALDPTSAEYVAVSGALVLNTALNDDREGGYVRTVTVDVSKVTAGAKSGGITDNAGGTSGTGGDGYLLYIADNSYGTTAKSNLVNSATGAATVVTSSVKRGVKLINGATLPSAGLTVATPHTVYIQGDYNTGSSSGTQPDTNTASSYTPPTDTPSPVVKDYNRAPAAVVGDAVNILSNAWNDATSTGSSKATSTTVNTAVVAGNVPTTSSSYSGGIENFTRFHEDWGSAYFTIYGALALLFDSEQATGLWSSAKYSPPSRRWYYDTLFQNANPPGFRVAHTYARGDRLVYNP